MPNIVELAEKSITLILAQVVEAAYKGKSGEDVEKDWTKGQVMGVLKDLHVNEEDHSKVDQVADQP